MGIRPAQASQRRLFKTFAHPDQTRKALAIELFDQAIHRYGKFDKAVERAFADIGLPARLHQLHAVTYFRGMMVF